VNERIASGPLEAIRAKELKPLVVGGDGQRLTVLIDLRSDCTLTVDERILHDPASGASSGLVALARVLFGRGDAADSSGVKKACAHEPEPPGAVASDVCGGSQA